jgi:nucleotide-binding universal stress UspA family protein
VISGRRSSRRRFVVGVDGSDDARRALRWAIDEAEAADADLDVVHAWDLPVSIVPLPINPAYARHVDVLKRAASAIVDTDLAAVVAGRPDAVHIEKIVVRGSPAGALIETAKGADLLVVGSRGHGGFIGLLLGSVSSQCVHHAPCPVAVIRGDVEPSFSDRAVVGTDGSDCSYAALIWALERASRRGSALTVLAAWSWLDQPGRFDPGYGVADVRTAIEALVARARVELDDGGRDVHVMIQAVNDHPAPALIDASREAGLLVVGSRGLGGFRQLSLGSVSSHCIHHAHCPVVVVRGDRC